MKRTMTLLLALAALASPGPGAAHECEQEIAKGAELLDFQNRQILAMELTQNTPYVQAVRREFNYKFTLFLQARSDCMRAVQAEHGTPPAAGTGCGRDTDCKGDRICVSGACVSP